MDPVDEADFHKWYDEEHLAMLAKIPGYWRTSRYLLGPATAVTLGQPGRCFAIHEFDDLAGLAGKEAEAASATPWSLKHINDSRVCIMRGWDLVHSEGY